MSFCFFPKFCDFFLLCIAETGDFSVHYSQKVTNHFGVFDDSWNMVCYIEQRLLEL